MSQESNIGDSNRKRLHEVQGQFGFRSMYVPREENVLPDILSHIKCGSSRENLEITICAPIYTKFLV